MIKIGITGGIGSGKSLVCAVFNKLGVPVYKADDSAKLLMNTNAQIKEKLTAKFGPEVYMHNTINRPLLAEIIFNNKEALAYVNAAVHPIVATDFEYWCTLHANKQYVIEESALLFESGAYQRMDKIVTVLAPDNLRKQRVMKRDNITAAKVAQRMSNQMPDGIKAERSNYIIYNDGKLSLIEQILNLHNTFISSHS